MTRLQTNIGKETVWTLLKQGYPSVEIAKILNRPLSEVKKEIGIRDIIGIEEL